jgi:hypothetical protein
MMADSTAPKNSTWANSGVCCSTRVGSTSCVSFSSRSANSAGSIRVAE